MFRIFPQHKIDSNISWPTKGRPPILSTDALMNAVHIFEEDIGRAVGNKDMLKILKTAKLEDAKLKGISALSILSPTKISEDNYLSLLPQLEEERSRTDNVQRKSEVRFIAEHSFRNAVSYILTVVVTHYNIGTPDLRLKSMDKATNGA